MKKILILIMMLLFCATAVVATVTHTLTAPANLFETTDTSVLFNWTPSSSTNDTTGMTTWFYLSEVNNDTVVLNETVTVTNATWRNITITGLEVGFYKWELKSNDTDGNDTTNYRWFEIRDASNQSNFRWENDTGYRAMTLGKDDGNLNITGNLTLNDGGKITTTDNGNITILPQGSGITQVGDAGTQGHTLTANDDLFISGKLEVDGVSFFDSILTMAADLVMGNFNLTNIDALIFGNSSGGIIDSPTNSYLRIGDAGTTAHSLIANDDLFVSGKLEVAGVSFFDSLLTVVADLLFLDDQSALFGTSSDVMLEYDTGQTTDALVMGLSTDSRSLLVIETADEATDFGHTQQTNPTIFIQSADATDTADWLSLSHDQTNAILDSGRGSVRSEANLTVNGITNLESNLSIGDTSNYLLFEENVNGTDVLLKSYQSLDIAIEPSGGNIRLNGNTTATFFYGGMWNYSANASAWTFTLTQDIYHNLTGLTEGAVNGFSMTCNSTATGGCYLVAEKAGVYQINAEVSAEAPASTALYSLAVVKDFNVSDSRNCYARRNIGNSVGSFSVSCFLNLDIDSKINIQIENEENNNDIHIHTANLVASRVGG